MAKPIIVVGAGICGVSTALWLRRSGHEVMLIDQNAPGTGASFGTVSYTHLRAHETDSYLVCRLLLEKKKAY